VVLCGHWYGGSVVTGVADRVPDRIAALVYLDAFVAENGQGLHETLPPRGERRSSPSCATNRRWLEGASDSRPSIQWE
jgi:pimeloyl-ACP methyl ester carboxylesterase